MKYNSLLNQDLDLDIQSQDSIIMSLHSFTPIQIRDKFFRLDNCRGMLDGSFKNLFKTNGQLHYFDQQVPLTGQFRNNCTFKVRYLYFTIVKTAGDRNSIIITDVNVKGEFN